MTVDRAVLHATTVAVDGRGILITGPSGSGKSALAIELIVRGATLVADDRTCLCVKDGKVIATPPDTIAGLIEARQVGLLHVPSEPSVPLELAIDMSQTETQRLPETHVMEVLGHRFPCLHNSETSHFPSAVLLYIKGNL